VHGIAPPTTWLGLLLAITPLGFRRDDDDAASRTSKVVIDPLPVASATATSTFPPASAPRERTSQSEAPPTPDTEDFEGTVGTTENDWANRYLTRLVGVRSARHAKFDRVVFEFSGRVPGYHLEYIDRPVRQCGSGEATQIAGDAWLEVRMSPTDAHDDKGKPTAGERERKMQLGVLRELELTCDFEAVVTWVLGVASPNRYRILELQDPPRLVVDVKHQ